VTPFDQWSHLITDEIRNIAILRVLDGGNVASMSDLDQRSAKLALLLVREINPLEKLTSEEQAILTGTTLKTFRKLKQEGALTNVVNFIL